MKCTKFFFAIFFIPQIFGKTKTSNPVMYDTNGAFKSSAGFVKTCVRKCCPENEALHIRRNYSACKKLNFSDPFEFYDYLTLVPNVSKSDYCYVYGHQCPPKMNRIKEDVFYLQTNGSLLIYGGGEYPDALYPTEQYCIGIINNYPAALACLPKKGPPTRWQLAIGTYVSTMCTFSGMISSLFIIKTF